MADPKQDPKDSKDSSKKDEAAPAADAKPSKRTKAQAEAQAAADAAPRVKVVSKVNMVAKDGTVMEAGKLCMLHPEEFQRQKEDPRDLHEAV